MTIEEIAEWITAGIWDVPAIETREELKASVLSVLARAIQSAAEEARREAYEDAAKAMCGLCFEGRETFYSGNSGYYHKAKKWTRQGPRIIGCDAAAIRARGERGEEEGKRG